jgi:hypothetical protein
MSDCRLIMTIDPFLANQAFDAKAMREMSLVLESVCNALPIHVDDEAARIRVAEKIIKLAGHGMHGATLQATAIKEFEADSGELSS